MTQDEKWLKNYREVAQYMDTNHRNPSKHRVEDHLMLNWMKHQMKLMNKGDLKPDRVVKFKRLMARSEKLKRTNLWEEVVDETINNGILRSYQQEMLDRLQIAWMEHRSVMVQMPTGTGKTVLMAEVIRQANAKGVLIVAHRRELLEQIRGTVKFFGIDMEKEQVVVEGIQRLSRTVSSGSSKMDDVLFSPSLVIIDEAHHALAATYRELWERWPMAKFLGLTATPCRLSGEPFTDLFDVLVMSWSVREFIDKGWLTDFDYISVKSNSPDIKKVAGLDKRGLDGDYQTKQTALVLDTEESIEHLYHSYKQFAEGKKGIVYAINREHAQHIAAYYQEHGVRCAVIDSKTPAKERLQTVEAYRQQMLDVLVNCEIFTEGFDVPEVEFIQLARPTMSLALYLQQVGRGMRVSKGKDKVIVLDQVGLYLSMGLPTMERDWQGMFLGRVKGQGVPLSSYTITSIEEAVNKMLVNEEMVRLTDFERMKAELQQEWDRQQREKESKARREALRIAKQEELLKVDWHGNLGIFKEKGLYGIKRKEGDCLPAVYKQIKVLRSRNERYFALACLPIELSGNSILWTVITKDGKDLQVRMKGEYVRRGDGIFEFRAKEEGRFVTCLYDIEHQKSYLNARIENIGGVQFFYKYDEDSYILRGELDGRKRFQKDDVVYNDHIAIIGDDLFVKSKNVQRYQIAGYYGDQVIVKDGEGLLEIGKDGVTGKTLQRMPRHITTQPDFLLLGLRREKSMTSVNNAEEDQWQQSYQQKMLDQFWTKKRKSKSVLLEIPVGAGKAGVVMPVIREILRLRPSYLDRGKKVLIVTPRNETIGQITETLRRFYINPSLIRLNYISNVYESEANIITTDFIQQYLGRVDNNYLPTLIVYDEAHLISSNVYAMLQQRWPNARRIGMTATPIGLNGLALKKVFKLLIAAPSIQEFIKQGWMKKIDYVDLGIDKRMKERLDLLERRDERGDYVANDMARIVDTPDEVERLCQTYLKYAKGKRGIVCAINQRHAKHIEECYNSHGIKTSVYLDPVTLEGKQQIENLRNGNLKVLVEVKQFSDGFRCPDIDFVQLACPTRLLATYLHQVECGMRVESMGRIMGESSRKLLVLDHVGAKEKFGLPTDERDWKKLFEEGTQEMVVRKRTRKAAVKDGKKVMQSPSATKWQLRMQLLLGSGVSENNP